MSFNWQVIPTRFHYLKNIVLEARPNDLGIALHDSDLGRHVGPGEKLSRDERV